MTPHQPIVQPLSPSSLTAHGVGGGLNFPAPLVPANPAIYFTQATYPLNQTEFDTLLRGRSKACDLGAAIALFGCGTLLPAVATFIDNITKLDLSVFWNPGGNKVAVGFVVIGLLLYLGGRIAGREQLAMRRRIRKHFTDNPGQHTMKP